MKYAFEKPLKASVNSNSAQIVTSRSTNDQLLEEINKLLSFTQHVTVKTDVLKWCKEKAEQEKLGKQMLERTCRNGNFEMITSVRNILERASLKRNGWK